MEKVELKRYNGRHVFERCTTSNPTTIANFIRDYIFVNAHVLADGTVTSILYKHRRFERETLIMKFV